MKKTTYESCVRLIKVLWLIVTMLVVFAALFFIVLNV